MVASLLAVFYARREDEQVRISEVRSGSYELIIETLANNTEAVTSLVMISLLVKYLPGALESLAASYRDYEEAKFTREKRKQLRKQIEEDEKLQSLDRNKQNQLVRYLDYLYERDRKHLKNVGEFSKRSVIDVLIRIANKVE
jgi:ABC-type transport system involved in Fe-S cluster assembly fused permease/ATPase subunit